MVQKTDGPSPCGYHFISEYQRCPRKWYIRNVLQLEPVKTKTPLIFGHAWHRALEILLSDGSMDLAIQCGLTDLEDAADRLEKPEDLPMLRDRIIRGIPIWWDTWLGFSKGWRPKTVEDERFVPIGDDLTFSVRFDGTILDPDGRPYIMEHKTTSWSSDKTVTSVELGDQVTGYYMAYNATKGPNDPNLAGTLLDVTEFKSSGITTTFWTITRSTDDAVNFELGLVGLFTELGQKIEALKDGHPPFELFPRSSEFCSVFGCEYVDICRARLEQKDLAELTAFRLRPANTSEEVFI